MVLPWLIVGACSALEMRRRNEPEASERECRRLQEVEKSLQRERKELDKKFKARSWPSLKACEAREVPGRSPEWCTLAGQGTGDP